jgi:hypothetical protein
MGKLSNKFKYKIEDNKLIIEPRPNGKTTIAAIRNLLLKSKLISKHRQGKHRKMDLKKIRIL